MEQTLGRLRLAWLQLKPFLRLRPHSGYIGVDVVLLLVVGALHHTVIPFLTRGTLPIDLMTPWLVTSLVLDTLAHGLILTTLGALILEMHSTAPAGLYLCAYWVVAVAIHLTRGTLSWRHALPWALTYAASQLWVICFTIFVLAVNDTPADSLSPFEWGDLGIQALRFVLGVGLGMLLCHSYLASGFKGEED